MRLGKLGSLFTGGEVFSDFTLAGARTERSRKGLGNPLSGPRLDVLVAGLARERWCWLALDTLVLWCMLSELTTLPRRLRGAALAREVSLSVSDSWVMLRSGDLLCVAHVQRPPWLKQQVSGEV